MTDETSMRLISQTISEIKLLSRSLHIECGSNDDEMGARIVGLDAAIDAVESLLAHRAGECNKGELH